MALHLRVRVHEAVDALFGHEIYGLAAAVGHVRLRVPLSLDDEVLAVVGVEAVVHDPDRVREAILVAENRGDVRLVAGGSRGDRKSTRLNSSHANISYAVFCLKK